MLETNQNNNWKEKIFLFMGFMLFSHSLKIIFKSRSIILGEISEFIQVFSGQKSETQKIQNILRKFKLIHTLMNECF